MDRQEIRDLAYLRKQNQDLITLLKQRQGCSAREENLCTETFDKSDIISANGTTNTVTDNEVVGISQPRRSGIARQHLSKYNKTELTDKWLNQSDKYASYRALYDGENIGNRKHVSQGIETTGPLSAKYMRYGTSDLFERNANDSATLEEPFTTHLEKDLARARELIEEGRLSLESDKTKTSTPFSTPQLTPQGTPKSILKRRKMIDDNVQVESQFPHTPISHLTPRNPQLNYSYSDIDDLDIAQRLAELEHRDSIDKRQSYSDATNGSYLEERALSATKCPPSKLQTTSAAVPYPDDKTKKKYTDIDKQLAEVDALMKKNRLQDAGNDRKHASIVRDLAQRPKAVVFDLEAPEPPSEYSRGESMQSSSLNTQVRLRAKYLDQH